MTTTFLNLPPHLLNSAALWYPQWTKYLLSSSTSQLLTSSTTPLSVTPSGQNTSSPPPLLNSSPLQLRHSLVPPVDKISLHLLNSTTLWYPQWTKYLLTSSPPQLRRSLVPPRFFNLNLFRCRHTRTRSLVRVCRHRNKFKLKKA